MVLGMMRIRRRTPWPGALAIAAAALLFPREGHAQRRGFGPNPDTAPSVFAYAFRGLGIGLPVGMATGYLVTRDGDWGTEEWKGLAYGAGLGAIGGSIGGLTAGFYDLNQPRPGIGMVVLRDTWYGTLLGATVGLITGGVILVNSGDAEHLAYGAAWGTVIGAPVGTVIGFIEGPTVRDAAWESPPSWALSLQPVPLAAQSYAREQASAVSWVPTVSGQF